MLLRSLKLAGQLLFAPFFVGLLACPGQAQVHSPDIRLNQIGFYPDAEKMAFVVGSTVDAFDIMTADMTEAVFSGTLGDTMLWAPAGEIVRLADFSALTETGEYVLVVSDLGSSHPFLIQDNVHQDAATASIKAYYFQRMSTSLDPTYAGVWVRAAGHPDTNVRVHASAASANRPTGTVIAGPRGWYDAGDYNKYVVNSGISTGSLLMLYEHFPEYYDQLNTNIPESQNDVPDLLDEIIWNVRWMLAMQDPEDGGIYHKLTTANFSGAVMPNQATAQRYVVMKGTAAALNFVAVTAVASRVIRPFDAAYPGLADSLLVAAHRAWGWAQTNPNVVYDQSAMNRQFEPDINTGEYGDDSFDDEFRWAAAEMTITTKQDSFVVMYPPSGIPFLGLPSWSDVDALGYVSLSFHREDVGGVDTAEINEALIGMADYYVGLREESATGTAMGTSAGDFFWGSNSGAANQGMMLIQAYQLTKEKRYLDAAVSNLDYLLGRNGTGFSYLTGHGDVTPMHPHHRQSEADQIVEPVPGLLAGGPNPAQQDGCTYPSNLPAKSFVDDWCSYASNEIAINWNAAFAYLAGAIEAIMSPTGKPVVTEDDEPALPDQGSLHKFEFSPNPSSDSIQIEFALAEADVVAITMFDMLGREVAHPVRRRSFNSGLHQESVETNNLPSGLYAMILENSNQRMTRIATVVR